MRGLPARLRVYITALCPVSVGLLAWLTVSRWPYASAPDGARIPVPIDSVAGAILFFLILTVLADISPIRLPRGGGMSAAFAVDFACILIYGPVVAAWVGWLSALLLMRNRPWYKIAFNGAQFSITSGLSGLAFELLGGQPAAYSAVPLLSDWYAIVAAGATYIAVNNAAVATVVSLEHERRLLGTWLAGFRWLTPQFCALAPFGILMATVYQAPHVRYIGVALFLFPLVWARYAFKGYTDMRVVHEETVRALTDALERYDPYTDEHSSQVEKMAEDLARALGYPETEMDALRFAARLHDIGKFAMEPVLNKKEKLTDEDWALIKQHPLEGEKIAQVIGVDYKTLKTKPSLIVRQTHERPDARGYPNGLAGKDIHMAAKIIAVVDAYHAMTSDRPYRPALSLDTAIEELEKGAGTQFDERVVRAFIEVIRKNHAKQPQPEQKEDRACAEAA